MRVCASVALVFALKKQSQKTKKNRQNCLEYAIANYSEFNQHTSGIRVDDSPLCEILYRWRNENDQQIRDNA